MTKHTEGQLRLGPHNCVMGGPEREVKGTTVLFTVCSQEWMEPGEHEANARRLVACWNACQGLDTDLLESITMLGETLADRFELRNSTERELTTQRDELLEALEHLMEMTEPPEPNCSCHTNPPCNDCIEYGGLREAWEGARGAIASVNKGAS